MAHGLSGGGVHTIVVDMYYTLYHYHMKTTSSMIMLKSLRPLFSCTAIPSIHPHTHLIWKESIAGRLKIVDSGHWKVVHWMVDEFPIPTLLFLGHVTCGILCTKYFILNSSFNIPILNQLKYCLWRDQFDFPLFLKQSVRFCTLTC